MGRRKIRHGSGQRAISGKDFRLADEIRYIQRRAAAYGERFVTVGPLALFSTDTGDAWLLDPADDLAARVARAGDPEPIHFEEPKRTSQSAGRETTILTALHSCISTAIPLALSPSSAIQPHVSQNWADLKISNMFG